jgi:8-oxo-dGTP pyrophosphatase MutT (NUDIX family)
MSKWVKFINEGEQLAAGIVVCIRDNSQILILRRSNIDERSGEWTLPGGHIDNSDRSIEAGAVRELKEETNLDCSVNDLQFLGEPKPEKYYFFAKQWVGDVKVDIPNPKTGEIEHDDHKWVTVDDVKELEDTKIPIYLLEKALEISKNENNS